MTKPLKISNDLYLPVELVTQSIAILAKRGSGKSYCASVIAEEFLKAGQQIVVLDPTGAWWGLQSSADGKHEGFPVVVFGGDHGNVPLEESAGEVIAQAIVEKGFSAIIDLTLLRKGQANRFAATFLETLYRLNREPLHLFVDEADAFAPQKSFSEEARTLGAMEDIVRRGRKRGIGCTLITQRPAVINKNVLTQCEVLIALKLLHPKDINAIMEWVNVQADEEQAKKMIDSLPSLPIGTAWVWSPGWADIFKRINVRERETFDSGATPKPGQKVKDPKKLAPIDIDLLGEAIKATIEKKKSEDPSLLKKRIKELEAGESKNGEKEIEHLKHQLSVEVEARTYFYQQLKSVHDWFEKYLPLFQSAPNINLQFSRLLGVGEQGGHAIMPGQPDAWDGNKGYKIKENKNTVTSSGRTFAEKFAARWNTAVAIEYGENGKLPKCERAILSALVIYGERNKNALGILSGYSATSGGFNNALGKLRTLNYISHQQPIYITEEGRKAIGKVDSLPQGKELHQYWYNKLPKCEREILMVLIRNQGTPMDKVSIAQETDPPYSHTSGGFNNALGKLRTLELIEGYGLIKASDSLFE